jgi:hypothetical protein
MMMGIIVWSFIVLYLIGWLSATYQIIKEYSDGHWFELILMITLALFLWPLIYFEVSR